MHYLEIEGNAKLSGKVAISGAKNAALPLIAAALIIKNDVTLKNMPNVADIKTLATLLVNLGAKCEFTDDHTLKITLAPRRPTTTSCVKCAPLSWCLARC